MTMFEILLLTILLVIALQLMSLTDLLKPYLKYFSESLKWIMDYLEDDEDDDDQDDDIKEVDPDPGFADRIVRNIFQKQHQ